MVQQQQNLQQTGTPNVNLNNTVRHQHTGIQSTANTKSNNAGSTNQNHINGSNLPTEASIYQQQQQPQQKQQQQQYQNHQLVNNPSHTLKANKSSSNISVYDKENID
jgi:hypothetical protein